MIPSPISQCCANNRWNRILFIVLAFVLGVILTASEVLPGITKPLFQSSSSSSRNEDHEEKNLKSGPKTFFVDKVDHSNIVDNSTPPPSAAPTTKKKEKKKQDKPAGNPERDGDKYKSATCNYECLTDRLGNKKAILPGQALCNRQHRFGLSDTGDFLVHDCKSDEKIVFWNASDSSSVSSSTVKSVRFEMKKDGLFQIRRKEKVLAEFHPKRTISFSKKCLSHHPVMDCPYLHLRSSGMVVVNWEDDETGKWMDRDMKRIYPLLYPTDGEE
eukprot:scaffold22652_cov153-Cylindrotheca_fusiformis.AAC.1